MYGGSISRMQNRGRTRPEADRKGACQVLILRSNVLSANPRDSEGHRDIATATRLTWLRFFIP